MRLAAPTRPIEPLSRVYTHLPTPPSTHFTPSLIFVTFILPRSHFSKHPSCLCVCVTELRLTTEMVTSAPRRSTSPPLSMKTQFSTLISPSTALSLPSHLTTLVPD